jgi:cytochrome c-type biogenesis protein CcsB
MISQMLGAVMLIYLLAAILFLMAELWSSARLQEGGRIALWLGLGLHTGALLGRWWESYHLALSHTPAAAWTAKLQLIVIQAPLSNFYESLIFFAWCLPGLGLLSFRRYLKGYLGAVVALLATLLLAYASFGADSSIRPLMPALKSNWLLIHVVTAFLGYAAFALAFGTAILYLFQERRPRPSLPPLPLLDDLIYRTTVLGFILLTLGIATGAVWAETAWGKYWSWDPKEAASLVTWLIYAALLHARLLKGWHGRRIAWLAVIGFMAVLFTYFGINYLSRFINSQHSYMT